MKVVITARDYSKYDRAAIELLMKNGLEIVDLSEMGCGTGTTPAQMTEYIGDADIAITGLEPMQAETIENCPNLKMLSKRSIGYDSVDLNACKAAGIAVTRTAGAVEAAVAEHVIAFVMYFAREIVDMNAAMHEGDWKRIMSYGAKSRTMGLVGFGGIGKEIAVRARALGMNVIYYCRHPKEEDEAVYGVKSVSLDELLAQSDYISVNVPLTPATERMFGAAEFAKMKKECVFINIARGQVMDDKALAEALNNGLIRGAGIDVFDSEPCRDSVLKDCKNAIITPHTAPFTSENFCNMNMIAAQNVVDFLCGCVQEKNKLV